MKIPGFFSKYKWDCNACGRCCSTLRISMTEDDLNKMESLGYDVDKYAFVDNGEVLLAGGAGNPCKFLEPDGKCGIQLRHGHDAKFEVCRHFPTGIFCGDFDMMPEGASPLHAPLPGERDYRFFFFKEKVIGWKKFSELVASMRVGGGELFQNYFRLLKGMGANPHRFITKGVDVAGIQVGPGLGLRTSLCYLLARRSARPAIDFPRLVSRRGTAVIRFLDRELRIDFDAADRVGIGEESWDRLLGLMPDIIESQKALFNFPAQLLFISYFCAPLAKSIASEAGKSEATDVDLVNAFSLLNGIPRFQLVHPVCFSRLEKFV